ncbi:MAG: regulatory protein RecX [Rhodospirillales bacterium]|nr:regulatory protein RecX [Rhodospirillales bacterium]
MSDDPKQTRAKVPRKITETSLRNSALYYLQRYASSCENLKRVLMRRVMRAAQVHETDIDEASGWIDNLIERLTASGLLDDRIYAEGRMRALFRRGVSPRGIAQRLQQKGIDGEIIEQMISKLHELSSNPNLLAAVKYAKRRRLGPFRPQPARDARFEKDLAALARAGFDYQTALRVISAASIAELEEIAEDVVL